MPSRLARIIEAVLKFLNVKNSKLIKRIERLYVRFIPLKIIFRYNIGKVKILGRNTITLCHKRTCGSMHIVYLHGGAYTQKAFPVHWRLMRTLVDRLKCKVTFIDYPLAPEHNYLETYEMLEKSYAYLMEKYHDDEFFLMGDSAGGGLALAFLQKLRNEGKSMPHKTVLYSPWLDITMSNPGMKELEDLDLMLNADGLIQAGIEYADGESDRRLPLLSPIYGDMNGLGDVAVFYGTHEIFFADCELLREKVKEADSRFVFFPYIGMQHDFILLPIPEAGRALEETLLFLIDTE